VGKESDMDITTILLGAGLLMLAFALIAIRLIILKNGEYKAACSSNKEDLAKMGVDCPVCGNDPEKCENTPPAVSSRQE
jgi:hypothetical protein